MTNEEINAMKGILTKFGIEKTRHPMAHNNFYKKESLETLKKDKMRGLTKMLRVLQSKGNGITQVTAHHLPGTTYNFDLTVILDVQRLNGKSGLYIIDTMVNYARADPCFHKI